MFIDALLSRLIVCFQVPNQDQHTTYETDSTSSAYDSDEDWEFDWSREAHSFAVLDSSLPVGQPGESLQELMTQSPISVIDPGAHPLTSYAEAHATAQSQEQLRVARPANPTADMRKPHRTKWRKWCQQSAMHMRDG